MNRHLALTAVVVRDHGEGALLHAVERAATLSLAGDTAGAARWQAIAARLAQLTASRRNVQ